MVKSQEQDPALGAGHQQAEAEEGAGFQVIGPAQVFDQVFGFFRSAFQTQKLDRDLVMNHMAIFALMHRIGGAQDAVTGHQLLQCFLPAVRINLSLE